MDLWFAAQAFILGVVEGLTEFLPVSSTGHQIIVADLLGFGGDRAKAFNIIIQLGAILAVVWEFRQRILSVLFGLASQRQAQRFTANLLIAFFPAVVLGLALADLIEHWLFNPITVASALVIGGLVMLWAERRKHTVKAATVDDMTWRQALKVGCAQCLALIPGTSRSASTMPRRSSAGAIATITRFPSALFRVSESRSTSSGATTSCIVRAASAAAPSTLRKPPS